MLFKYTIDHEVELKMLDIPDTDTLFRLTDSNRWHLREWMPWIDGTRTPNDTRSFIENTRQSWAKGDNLTTGILFHGELCGVIDLHALNWMNRKTSIGYWLAGSYQGRGIMTRACRAMVDYAINGLQLHRIEILAGVHNYKSRAIPERLGFQQEGIARGAQRLYDRYIDLAVYSMLAEEWNARSGFSSAAP